MSWCKKRYPSQIIGWRVIIKPGGLNEIKSPPPQMVSAIIDLTQELMIWITLANFWIGCFVLTPEIVCVWSFCWQSKQNESAAKTPFLDWQFLANNQASFKMQSPKKYLPTTVCLSSTQGNLRLCSDKIWGIHVIQVSSHGNTCVLCLDHTPWSNVQGSL